MRIYNITVPDDQDHGTVTSSSEKVCDVRPVYHRFSSGDHGAVGGSAPSPRDMLKDLNSTKLPKPCPPGAHPPGNPQNNKDHNLNFNMPDKSQQGSKFMSNKMMEDKHIPSIEKNYDDKVIPGQNKVTAGQDKGKKSLMGFLSVSGKGDKSMCSVQENEIRSEGPAEESKGNMGEPSMSLDLMDRVKSHEGLSTLNQDGSCDADTAMAIINTPSFTYKEINQATNGFNDQCKLGQGGFGEVFKGRLKNSQCAIKRLFSGSEGDQESQSHLKTELKALIRYRHENIVALYGYTLEGSDVCLVYQFMPNGSLEDRLSCKSGTRPLTWQERLQITRAAACGLQYLHTLGAAPLIHGDIKSANILLDKHLEAKISDLGMAKHAQKGSTTGALTHITKQQMGTKEYTSKAYMPPEAQRGSQMSIKGDTFSYGVVMLEVCTGEQAYDEKREGGDAKYLERYVTEYLEASQTRYEDLRDSKAGMCSDDVYNKLFHIALQCTQKKKKDRPDMVKVYLGLEELENHFNDLPILRQDSQTTESLEDRVADLSIQQEYECEDMNEAKKREAERKILLRTSDPEENEILKSKRDIFFGSYLEAVTENGGYNDECSDDSITMVPTGDPQYQENEFGAMENMESLDKESTLTENSSIPVSMSQQNQEAVTLIHQHQQKIAFYEGVVSEEGMGSVQESGQVTDEPDLSVENNNDYTTEHAIPTQESNSEPAGQGHLEVLHNNQQEVVSNSDGCIQSEVIFQHCVDQESAYKQQNDNVDHLFASCRNLSPNSSQLWQQKRAEPSESECFV
ncbi:receptor-like kinase LIP2 isoform X2 [Mizuhopecten yessoensis]|uniref:receptor-like kinase LIP2 isoform X2 n=1 Tax=Mizuhopecten yessoensis TaxID=6573 RepID=UPI000B458ACB|nr:receptor-like kinase LIP2 isoform X2 [Mizuhopecten yessoensis]